jgi:hypothetical protein
LKFHSFVRHIPTVTVVVVVVCCCGCGVDQSTLLHSSFDVEFRLDLHGRIVVVVVVVVVECFGVEKVLDDLH